MVISVRARIYRDCNTKIRADDSSDAITAIFKIILLASVKMSSACIESDT